MQNPIVQQVVETLRGASNVLVTVKNNPSVDELTAAIALTLILNHMNKHATTVFSGQVPSTIEFLQPEMAIESNTDSLRDFIIALDKAKADKLRYKVEDNVVRIFITPYRSSISEEDLEFSQGDFNVDVVVALGVLNKDDFDEAVMAHGGILHDATVIAVTKEQMAQEVGAINWQDQQASSVSEMVASISELFGAEVIDSQIATALMTGIVAETDRFKNTQTTPQVLSISSMLMAAGANQQLIAEKLEHPLSDNSVHPIVEDTSNDGMLDVAHADSDDVQGIHIDEQGNIGGAAPSAVTPVAEQDSGSPSNLMQEIIEESGDETAEKPVEESVEESAEEQAEEQVKEPAEGTAQESPDEKNSDELPTQDVPTELKDEEDSPHSVVTSRSILAPPPMNANSDGKSALDEPTGLFGNSMHTKAEEKHDSEESHKPKVLEPISDEEEGKDSHAEAPPMPPTRLTASDNDNEPPSAEAPSVPSPPSTPVPVPPAPVSADVPAPPYKPPSSTEVKPLVAPAVPAPQPTQEVNDTSPDTLEDIERSVHSSHVSSQTDQPSSDKSVDDYLGSLKQPKESPAAPARAPDELPALPDFPAPAQVEDTSGEKNSPEPAAPEAEDSQAIIPKPQATAPAVPPPLMPQAPSGSLPQFYESDGSKSSPLAEK